MNAVQGGGTRDRWPRCVERVRGQPALAKRLARRSAASSTLAFALIYGLSSSGAFAQHALDDDNVFYITRSKNRNEVHYDGNITDDCRWRDPPVRVYWRNHEEGPDARGELGWWEIPAYGFDARAVNQTQVVMRLQALPELLIAVRLHGGSRPCRIVATVENEDHGEVMTDLRSVYVYSTETFWFFPTVHYIDLLGCDSAGRPVSRRIRRTEVGQERTPVQADCATLPGGADRP